MNDNWNIILKTNNRLKQEEHRKLIELFKRFRFRTPYMIYHEMAQSINGRHKDDKVHHKCIPPLPLLEKISKPIIYDASSY